MQAAVTELQQELEPGSLYYEGAGAEALKKWRAMSEEEREKLKKGDDID